MAVMKRGYVDTPRGQVHYATAGTGEPLLLLHQTPRASQSFARIVPFLAREHQAIAVDTPGFGDSDPLPQPFEIADLAQTMVDLLDGMGIRRVQIFGHHTGAAIAGEMAAQQPERVKALVLSGFPYMTQDDERRLWIERAHAKIGPPGGLPVVKPELDGSHLTRLWHRGSVRLWWGKGQVPEESVKHEDLEFLNDYIVDAMRARHGAEETFLAVFRYDADHRLPLIKAPTLFVEGSSPYERAICQRSDILVGLVPGSKIVTIKDADANVIYWKARELSEVILAFLRDPQRYKGEPVKPSTGEHG